MKFHSINEVNNDIAATEIAILSAKTGRPLTIVEIGGTMLPSTALYSAYLKAHDMKPLVPGDFPSPDVGLAVMTDRLVMFRRQFSTPLDEVELNKKFTVYGRKIGNTNYELLGECDATEQSTGIFMMYEASINGFATYIKEDDGLVYCLHQTKVESGPAPDPVPAGATKH